MDHNRSRQPIPPQYYYGGNYGYRPPLIPGNQLPPPRPKPKKNNGSKLAMAAALAVVGYGGIKAQINPSCQEGLQITDIACGFGLGDDEIVAAQPSSSEPSGACPLNGEIYAPEQQQRWEGHRPLGIVVENSTAARPQSGLSSADIVFEAVAEGGITRFLAVFECQDAAVVGPVRSARQITLDMVIGFGNNPLYAHAGGAESQDTALNALGRIADSGWLDYNDLDGLTEGSSFYRDEDRLSGASLEHTLYTSTAGLWELSQARGLGAVENNSGQQWQSGFRPYHFKTEAPAEQRPGGQSITIPFWGEDNYEVLWSYDPASNTYQRRNGGEEQRDLNTGEQLAAKNVVVLYVNEVRQADGSHTLHQTTGSGNAAVFMDGQYIQGTWERPDLNSQPLLRNADGSELSLNRGQIWFEIISTDSSINVS